MATLRSFDNELQFVKIPQFFLLVGPTLSGKSYVLKSMLSNAAKVFKPMPKRILFFYSVYQELYTEIAKQVYDNSNIVIDFQNGSTQEIISPEQLRDYTKGEPALVIFDDMTQQCSNSSIMYDLACQGRHSGALIVVIWHCLYPKGKFSTQIAQQANYLAIMASQKNRSAVACLASQTRNRSLATAFNDVCRKPYSYLFVDLTASCPPELSLRTDCLAGNAVQIVYPNNNNK